MVRLVALLAIGCGVQPQHASAPPATGSDVTLYRDAALVRQRFELDLTAGVSTAKVTVAAGVAPDRVLVLDRGEVALSGIHVDDLPGASPPPPKPIDEEDPPDDDDKPAAPPPAAKATELRLDVTAPRAGHYAITLAYVTDRLQWDAAYTMTTTPARDRAELRGAIAIRNSTGIALHDVSAHLVDADLGAWRNRTAEHLASSLVGGAQSSTPAATQRDLGRVSISDGETRVELAGIAKPRPMRSVLVYDPIGTKLDNPSASPVRDYQLGVETPAASRITESFEVSRDEKATRGLPAGPVRLLERRDNGAVSVLGESRLFEAATRVAAVDTIAVGTADGVTGHRERREITDDEDAKRLVEEFVITLDNTRTHDVEVLIREHLYRGQNWTLAYQSASDPTKEGAQQIAMRTVVPAHSQAKILYVVVYTWGQ